MAALQITLNHISLQGWRIMTGENASKDLAAPFASFVSTAWASLGKDLPEISWANQIRRRKDTLSAAELVSWVDRIREFPVKQFRLRGNTACTLNCH
jgi:hypothetical protein